MTKLRLSFALAATMLAGSAAAQNAPVNQIYLGTGASTPPAFETLNGDCVMSNSVQGAITCTKTNGTSFSSAATTAIGTSGATIPVLSGSNTWSAPQYVSNFLQLNPAPGTAAGSHGLIVNQSFSGTAGGFAANQINVSSDTSAMGANNLVALDVEDTFGGSTTTGGRAGIWVDLFLNGATSSANTNRNYVAADAQCIAQTGDGGTGTTSSTSAGACFGFFGLGKAQSGATNLENLTGEELNVEADAGSSVWAKSILQLSSEPNDAVAGAGVDTMIWMYNQGGSPVTHKHAIYIDNNGGLGNWPISSSGDILATSSGSITNGIDLNSATISGCSFKSPQFCITGGGEAQESQVKITNATPYIHYIDTSNSNREFYAQEYQSGSLEHWRIYDQSGGMTLWDVSAAGVSANSSGTIITVNSAAGTGATASCASSHVCDQFSGEIALTTGTGPTPGPQVTVTFGVTRTNTPNCVVTVQGGTTFLAPGTSLTTSTLTFTVGAPPSSAANYTLDYVCGGN